MTPDEFKGKVALVTGAGGGIGLAEARALAELGAHVVINDVRAHRGATEEEGTAEEVAADLRAEGYSASADTGDISKEEYAVGLVERTVKQFGRIDILVNNAGVLGDGTAHETDTDRLMRTMSVNLFGPFWTQRTALRYMREKNYGRIINTSSGAGALGQSSTLPYNITKMAVLALSKTAALDNEHLDIKVNSICPLARSVMSREFWDSRTHVDPDSVDPKIVASVVAYLASENCSISGEVLSAGAGRWARIVVGKTAGAVGSFDPAQVSTVLEEIMDVSDLKILRASRDQYDQDEASRSGAWVPGQTNPHSGDA
ncbi:SDR family NAD(P)-dependent oxidoreductase [Nocardioides alcanivorans]|uniref:SDR family NAD(P)-dependent oxidoreductase n=1 Tax=Nocardioides alcanivorans TaxID=2897352 RepID=UPI001F28290A|nr:SDR family NAD(P)-dependent oxidoreductase [Nocardioides alcanivorans]